MALNEYQPDTTFPGVIGRATDENRDATVEESWGRSADLDRAGLTDAQGIGGPAMAGGRW